MDNLHKDKLYPSLKAELFTKSKLLRNIKVIDFLKKKNIQCLKDQDYNENVSPFKDVLKRIMVNKCYTPNHSWEISYNYKNSQGVVKINLHNRFNPEKPSLIYHHGLGEIYFPLQMNFVFDRSFVDKFNLFSIKASHHDRIRQVINSYINNYANLTSAIAASLWAVEEVVKLHKQLASTYIVACGASLGGIVTSLHYYFKCSADLYFPIISHPDLSKILLDPGYKNIVENQEFIKNNNSIINCFKIPKRLMSRNKSKIFPILGKYDMTINYKDSQKWWKNYQVLTLNAGHTSIFAKKEDIQNFIISKLIFTV